MTITRCHWVNSDPEYIHYHDHEWGKPVKNSQILFEILCLEGQQAGLSWYTILKKREGYRTLFYHFAPDLIAQLTPDDILELTQDSRIIRHKAKVEAIVNNAIAYQTMVENGENFSHFIWQFVNDQPIVNRWKSPEEVPISTPLSKELSKKLKKKGFKFIGPTTCYAFMQAAGLVNDHLVQCHCHG